MALTSGLGSGVVELVCGEMEVVADADFAEAAVAGGGAAHQSRAGFQFERMAFDNFVGLADTLCRWAFLLYTHFHLGSSICFSC